MHPLAHERRQLAENRDDLSTGPDGVAHLCEDHDCWRPDAQRVIEQAFNAAIPVTVPLQYLGLNDDAMRVALTAEAARLLVRLCTEMPLPRGPFVAAVAQAAQRKA